MSQTTNQIQTRGYTFSIETDYGDKPITRLTFSDDKPPAYFATVLTTVAYRIKVFNSTQPAIVMACMLENDLLNIMDGQTYNPRTNHACLYAKPNTTVFVPYWSKMEDEKLERTTALRIPFRKPTFRAIQISVYALDEYGVDSSPFLITRPDEQIIDDFEISAQNVVGRSSDPIVTLILGVGKSEGLPDFQRKLNEL